MKLLVANRIFVAIMSDVSGLCGFILLVSGVTFCWLIVGRCDDVICFKCRISRQLRGHFVGRLLVGLWVGMLIIWCCSVLMPLCMGISACCLLVSWLVR